MIVDQNTEEYYESDFNREWETVLTKYEDTLPVAAMAKERYSYFRNYTGQWYFLIHKTSYLKKDLGRNDINLLKSIVARLNEVRNHEKINTPDKKKLLYEKAIQCVQDATTGDFEFHMVDDFQIYLAILHENKYFNNLSIPDDYLDNAPKSKKSETFGNFYGEYFLLYDYLTDLLEKYENGTVVNRFPKILSQSSSLSPIKINKEDSTIFFSAMEKEVRLPAIGLTLYLFYLSKKEGVAFKELKNYKTELLDIYKSLNRGVDIKKAESAVRSLTDINDYFNGYVSSIKKDILAVMPENVAADYFIKGGRNKPYSIKIAQYPKLILK